MSAATKQSTVFDEIKKKAEPDAYIIQGNIRNRHKFRYLPAAERFWEIQEMKKDGSLRLNHPKSGGHPPEHLEYDEQLYEQSIIAVCDDEGMARTYNKEHAKLIHKEYLSMDPKARIHPLSKDFDPNEPVDRKVADFPGCKELKDKPEHKPYHGGGGKK